MKNHLKIILFLLYSLFFISCSHVLHNDLLKLKKGLTTAQVLNIIDDNIGTHYISIESKDVFNVKIKSDSSNRYSLVIAKKYMNLKKQYYIFSFKNDKLNFWGTPLEFARNDSSIINEIGKEAVKYIEKDM